MSFEKNKRKNYALNIVYKTVYMWIPKFPDHVDLDFLIDIGKETLFTTRKQFNPDKKVKFKTYLITSLNNRFKSELNRTHKKNSIYNFSSIDVDTLPDESGQGDLDIVANIVFLTKRLSKESLEVMDLILKAPAEMIKLGYSNRRFAMKSILKHAQVSTCEFNRLRREALRVLK